MKKGNIMLCKIATLFLALTLVFTSISVVSYAEPEEPLQEEPLKVHAIASAEESLSGNIAGLDLKVSWEEPEAATENTKYMLRIWTDDINAATSVVSNETEYKFLGAVENKKTTHYQVGYFDGEYKENYEWSNNTATGSVSPNYDIEAPTLDSVTALEEESDVTILWTKGSLNNVSKFQLWHKGVDIDPTMVCDDLDDEEYTYIEPVGDTYEYTVRAIYSEDEAIYAESNGYECEVISYISSLKSIGWKVTTKGTTKLYKSSTSSSYYKTIPAGTVLTPKSTYPSKVERGKNPKRIKVTYGGKTGWIAYGNANGGIKGITSAADYTKSLKESFVNSKKYTSSTSYLVWLSKYTQRVYVFKKNKETKKWELVRTCRGTSGKFVAKTASGKFTLKKHLSRRYTQTPGGGTKYYYNNLTYFWSANSFHSICYYTTGKNKGQPFNNINKDFQPTTSGCIRMLAEDALYIYKLPLKTRVISAY